MYAFLFIQKKFFSISSLCLSFNNMLFRRAHIALFYIDHRTTSEMTKMPTTRRSQNRSDLPNANTSTAYQNMLYYYMTKAVKEFKLPPEDIRDNYESAISMTGPIQILPFSPSKISRKTRIKNYAKR